MEVSKMTSNSGTQKVIIDTDCGIDDAIAIMLALSNKKIAEVIAVTCCFGNTSLDNVCKNVMRVLVTCDSTEIPIYRGSSGSLLSHNIPETAHGSDGLGNCAHGFSTGGMEEKGTPAAVALIELAKKYPKEITLIAIGPLTNVALAHRIDPEFTNNLKSIVCMGGNYKGIGNTTEVAEFNFYCDPEAANIVVSEATCPFILIPWETTMDYGIEWEFYREMLAINTKKGNFFSHISKYFADRGLKRGNNRYRDCDFLAVAAALYPDCVKRSLEHALVVECEGAFTKGLTILLTDSNVNGRNRNKIKIITDFDVQFINNLRKYTLE